MSRKGKRMKAWTGWCIVDGHGNHLTTPVSTRRDVEEDLRGWSRNGARIARVLVREVRTKRKGRSK